MGEAATAAREIAGSISGVAQAAGTAAAGVDQTRTAAGELARMAGDLQQLVSRFRYDDEPSARAPRRGARSSAALASRSAG